MKICVLISRILLGSLFTIFGLNGFLNFMPSPPLPALAAQFMGALFVSKYLMVIFALQLTAGVLLLINRFVPLALTILAPILVNIVVFHVCMSPTGFAPGAIACALWTVLLVRERTVFAPLWSSKGSA